MTRALVNPGICGMVATIEIVKSSKYMVRMNITSDCEMVTKMRESLAQVDLREALKAQVYSQVYRYASQCRICASCPVPMAILKTIEIEAGLALPQSVFVHFETTEPE